MNLILRESLEHIESTHYPIDDKIINGIQFTLFRSNEYGDEIPDIIVNRTCKFYSYTWNSIDITLKNHCSWYMLHDISSETILKIF